MFALKIDLSHDYREEDASAPWSSAQGMLPHREHPSRSEGISDCRYWKGVPLTYCAESVDVAKRPTIDSTAPPTNNCPIQNDKSSAAEKTYCSPRVPSDHLTAI